MQSIKIISFVLAMVVLPSSSFAGNDSSTGLLRKITGQATAGIAALFALGYAAHTISETAIIPKFPLEGMIQSNEFSSEKLSQSKIQSVKYWEYELHEPQDGKALLVMPGNAWGFEEATRYSRRLLDNEKLGPALRKLKVNVFTMAYLGHGSTMNNSSMKRSQLAQIIAVKEMIRHIMSKGYKASDITIFAHSIGGMLSGCALAGEPDFEDIKLLTVASPKSIGKIFGSTVEKPLNYLTGWTNKPEAAFTNNHRIAINSMHFDSVVPYSAGIASAIENKSCKGVITEGPSKNHNNFRDLETSIQIEESQPSNLRDVLISLISTSKNP